MSTEAPDSGQATGAGTRTEEGLRAGFRLGDWEVLPQQGSMRRGEERKHVEPRVMDVLVYLAERPGEVVSRDTLIRAIWETTYVSEEVLTRCISELRAHLGDSSRSPRYIRTVPKRGYSLIERVGSLEPAPVVSIARSPATMRSAPVTEPDAREPERPSESPPIDKQAAEAPVCVPCETPLTRRPWVISMAALLLVVLGVSLGLLLNRNSAPEAPPSVAEAVEPSIAVLPFANLSSDPSDVYFSDGLAEELLNAFAQIQGLKVAARSSSFAFRGSEESIGMIGAKLGVSAILEGSVRRVGKLLRITARLNDVDGGFTLWSETYERTLDDVFAIQDGIAQAVVSALKVTLLGDEQAVVRKPPSGSFDAYNLYLLGRHQWHARTRESLNRAADLFQQAIELDPDYVLAYTGLADSYLLLAHYGFADFTDNAPPALRATQRALELDPELSEAHASMGLYYMGMNVDEKASAALQRAIELKPANAMAHMWMGLILEEQGDFAGAIKAHETAYAREPLSFAVNHNLAYSYLRLGRFDKALVHLGNVAALRPEERGRLYQEMGEIHAKAGDFAKAVVQFGDSLQADPHNVNAVDGMARAYLGMGDLANAERWLDMAVTLGPMHDNVGWTRVLLAIANGRYAEALAAEQPILQAYLERERASGVAPGANRLALASFALYLNGRNEEARVLIEQVLESYRSPQGLLVDKINLDFLALAAALAGPDSRWSAQELNRMAQAYLGKVRAMGVQLPDNLASEALFAASLEPHRVVGLLEEAVELGEARGWLLDFIAGLAGVERDAGYVRLRDAVTAANRTQREELARMGHPQYQLPRIDREVAAGDIRPVARAGEYFIFEKMPQLIRVWREEGADGGAWRIHFAGHPTVALRPWSPERFRVAETGDLIDFIEDADSGEIQLRMQRFGKLLTARRFDGVPEQVAAPIEAARMQALAGYYVQSKDQFSMSLKMQDGVLYAQSHWLPRVPLRPLSDDEFYSDEFRIRFQFLFEQDDRPSTLELQVAGRQVPMQRKD